MSEVTTLWELADLQVGYAFKSAEFVDPPLGIRLARCDNLGHGSLRWEGAKAWDGTDTQVIQQYSLDAGDVLIGMDRPWIASGLKRAVVRSGDLPALLVQRVARLRAKPGVDQGFIRVLIESPDFTDHVLAVQTGTTIPHISGKQILQFRPPRLPALAEQRAIAGVLGALDDKIESNRRADRLALELLASTWIKYASEAPTGRVGQIASLSTQRVLDGSAEVTVLSATSAGLLVPSDEFFEKRVYSKDISKYLLVHPWAFAYNPSRANIGSIGLNTGPGLGAVSPVYVVAQTAGPPSAWWLELALRTPQVRNDIEAFSTGSVRQVLRFDDLTSIEIPLPEADALDRFFADVDPLIQLRERVARESRTLESLRDALLPELLSGRLRVREAEEMVGSV